MNKIRKEDYQNKTRIRSEKKIIRTKFDYDES